MGRSCFLSPSPSPLGYLYSHRKPKTCLRIRLNNLCTWHLPKSLATSSNGNGKGQGRKQRSLLKLNVIFFTTKHICCTRRGNKLATQQYDKLHNLLPFYRIPFFRPTTKWERGISCSNGQYVLLLWLRLVPSRFVLFAK